MRLPAGLRASMDLAKIVLCSLIGCSALFGYLLAASDVSSSAFITGLGIFFLAAGCGTLNSIQERRLDRFFARTRKRPLAEGRVGVSFSFFQAIVLCVGGLLLLWSVSANFLPLFIALLAVVLYNGVYTPLKRRTVLAIIPGAVCGALPPCIGWLVGGGRPLAFEAFLLFFLLFLWQVPHFWLILLRHGEDYKKNIIPSFFSLFGENVIKRFFVTWIGSLAAVMILFTVLPTANQVVVRFLVLINGLVLLSCFFSGLAGEGPSRYRHLFGVLNFSLLFHMVIVSVGNIV
ncbi:UbiA family prenyltransferase [Desulfomarina sp.]